MISKGDPVRVKRKGDFIFVEGVRLCKVVDAEIEIKGWVMNRGQRKPKMGRCTIEELVQALGEICQH